MFNFEFKLIMYQVKKKPSLNNHFGILALLSCSPTPFLMSKSCESTTHSFKFFYFSRTKNYSSIWSKPNSNAHLRAIYRTKNQTQLVNIIIPRNLSLKCFRQAIFNIGEQQEHHPCGNMLHMLSVLHDQTSVLTSI